MATIDSIPPQGPRWALGIDAGELEYLLAACDFALQFLHGIRHRPAGGTEWPMPMAVYVTNISAIEQVLASVDPRRVSNG